MEKTLKEIQKVVDKAERYYENSEREYKKKHIRYLFANLKADIESGDLFSVLDRGAIFRNDNPYLVKMENIAKQWAIREYVKRMKEFIRNDEVFLDALSTALVDQLSRKGPSIISIGRRMG